ncbi:MAG: hypothetical protein ACRDJV_15620 [Actinomycetota bacterium]
MILPRFANAHELLVALPLGTTVIVAGEMLKEDIFIGDTRAEGTIVGRVDAQFGGESIRTVVIDGSSFLGAGHFTVLTVMLSVLHVYNSAASIDRHASTRHRAMPR